MICVTIRDTLIFENNRVYVVRGMIDVDENERVIYVGKAWRQSVAERLCHHLRGNEKGRQRFGEMLASQKLSPQWKVEARTIKECGEYLGKTFESVDDAEKAMIEWLKPMANGPA